MLSPQTLEPAAATAVFGSKQSISRRESLLLFPTSRVVPIIIYSLQVLEKYRAVPFILYQSLLHVFNEIDFFRIVCDLAS